MYPFRRSNATGLFAIAVLLTSIAPAVAADDSEWAYSKPCRSAVPTVKHTDWLLNPVDAYILARLEKNGLEPATTADKVTLLRRVTFDLTGLLPTSEECDRFLADHSPDAYEHVVDRLLQSPRFGERWAEHWLDVVRFAETDGYKLDGLRPDAYRYRDYVIRAFNDDMPYDRFVRQQIAGDELEPNNPDAQVATGLLRLHPEETNGSNYRRTRQDILNDVTDNFGVTFLGLTVGCARCHDHKFDPISHKDYYSLQAFFAPMVQCNKLLAPQEVQADWKRRQEQWETATAAIRTKIEALVAAPRQAIRDEDLATFDAETQTAVRTAEAERTILQQQLAALALKQIDHKSSRPQHRLNAELRAQFDKLQVELSAFDKLRPEALPTAMATRDVGPLGPPVFRLAGGSLERPREELKPAIPHALGAIAIEFAPASEHPNSTGFRAALACWLTRPDHPLTARVIVNRLWQYHMGQGLQIAPNDFGAQGGHPTHPELLDTLAIELVKHHWSLKAIHRLIVTSAAYKQSSRPEDNPVAALAAERDPSNKLLWHARAKRREAESIRDVILQVSGRLNLRMYGSSAHPVLPEPLMKSRYSWYADERMEDRNRRSVYVFVKRNMRYPMFGAFDGPDRMSSCPTRSATITAPQALVMLHGTVSSSEAEQLGGSLVDKFGKDAAPIVRAAYARMFNRLPSSDELTAAEKFLERQAKLTAADANPAERPPIDPFKTAVIDFCHALMNSAELIYVD